MHSDNELMKIWKKIQAIFHTVSTFQRKLFTEIFLQVIYVVGLGLTSIAGKIFGKKFLGIKNDGSSWEKHEKIVDIKRMF